REEGVDGVIEIRAVVERTGDDQRRTRLVDQDRVDFVDDGVEVAALDHVLQAVLHVVAQVVEAVFVVGAVGDIARIGFLALGIVQSMDDHTAGAGGPPAGIWCVASAARAFRASPDSGATSGSSALMASTRA